MSTPKKPSPLLNILLLSLIGLSLGWLIGLSVSPVLHIIVGSLITTAVTFISILAGIHKTSESTENTKQSSAKTLLLKGHINIVPFSVVMITIAMGASIGIYFRTNDKLGLNPNSLMNKWVEDSATRDSFKIELFKKLYFESTSGPKGNQYTAGLFNVTVSNCDLLNTKNDDDLKNFLLIISNGKFDSLINSCQSEECLIEIKKLICPNN